ncbi:hypothetical protein [Streptomyces sp. CAU 1734]|uniref:hypothetical protein n=1 Tax=Streptomyces sp. CAU 1734 TaxID=3140360 RepID=UPI00326069F0
MATRTHRRSGSSARAMAADTAQPTAANAVTGAENPGTGARAAQNAGGTECPGTGTRTPTTSRPRPLAVSFGGGVPAARHLPARQAASRPGWLPVQLPPRRTP